jgi:hypothetical protein
MLAAATSHAGVDSREKPGHDGDGGSYFIKTKQA